MESGLHDADVVRYIESISPNDLKRELPLTDRAKQTVKEGRKTIKNILDGKIASGRQAIHESQTQHFQRIENPGLTPFCRRRASHF